MNINELMNINKLSIAHYPQKICMNINEPMNIN